MNKKQRIAIDMDEVIADTIEKFINLYKRNHQLEIVISDMDGKEFSELLPPDMMYTARKYVNEPGFFRDIPVIKDSQQVVKELCEKYDVYIVSAAMEFKNSLIDKYEWLAEHFPFIPWTNIIFCGDKIVKVDIIIDDRIKNFIDFGGRKLLYSSPHNHLINNDDYERVDNWQQIAGKLL